MPELIASPEAPRYTIRVLREDAETCAVFVRDEENPMCYGTFRIGRESGRVEPLDNTSPSPDDPKYTRAKRALKDWWEARA